MRTYPPHVRAYTAGDQSPPDTRTPTAFLGWLLRRQAQVVALNIVFGLFWFLPAAVSPYLLGQAIDQGILPGDTAATVRWAALLALTITTGVLSGVAMHTAAVTSWLTALYGTTKLVTRKAAQMGHVLARRTPTGEVLSVASSDSDTFGAACEVFARAVAAFIAFLLVAGLVLSTSVKLGLVVLIAAPLLVGAASPLLRPLQRAQALERTRSGELTGLATDIVAGLRILRGIGGERTFGRNYADQSQKVRAAGVSAGSWQAGVDAVGTLLSGLLLVVLTWLGTRELIEGRLTMGELVSFFGYAVFMVWPIQTFFEFFQKWVQAVVSAGKTIAVLGQLPPWHTPAPDETPGELPRDSEIRDATSGFVARPGRFTVVVSALPDDSVALADRIGRYLATDTEPVSEDVAEDGLKGRAARDARSVRAARRAAIAARDLEEASRDCGVTVGGVDLAQVPMATIRSRILLSDASSQLFAGTLQEALDPHGRATREQAEEALRVANAEDVYDALPGGWQGVIDERGRGLSGGQRQRVVLARALLADADVLVLVEPTSAVDAHTEARIAARLAEHRRGRTTIVTTVSPLLLHEADEIAFLDAGKVVATGTHAELLAGLPAYRRVVARGMEEGR